MIYVYFVGNVFIYFLYHHALGALVEDALPCHFSTLAGVSGMPQKRDVDGPGSG